MHSALIELQLIVKITFATFLRCCSCDVSQNRKGISSTSSAIL